MLDKRALIELLSMKRPSCRVETYDYFRNFLHRYVYSAIREDIHKNFIVTVGDNPCVAFTSHYDTVHREFGANELYFDDNRMVFFTDTGKKGTPLGADDAAGIYIMLELINKQVPGMYVFFADEEAGGIGSSAIDKSLFVGIDIMISLDREGTSEVIIEQATCGPCASPEFGEWLADQLTCEHARTKYETSDRGVFTDSANFAGIIPECVNLSVGYYGQHTKYEELDYEHAVRLAYLLSKIDFAQAPVVGVVEDLSEQVFTENTTMYDYVYENPHEVANYLALIGVTIDEIELAIGEWDADYV